MCRCDYSCTINEGNSAEAAFVIAHEMGHRLVAPRAQRPLRICTTPKVPCGHRPPVQARRPRRSRSRNSTVGLYSNASYVTQYISCVVHCQLGDAARRVVGEQMRQHQVHHVRPHRRGKGELVQVQQRLRQASRQVSSLALWDGHLRRRTSSRMRKVDASERTHCAGQR